MKKFTPFRIGCITLLWIILCYMLIDAYREINLRVILVILTSGIIVFVPIYKQLRKKDD
ncbi:hypothetical protein [Coprobacter tertius]|uniref:Uncharacterized protein n=1 Tax=Coprobacter tertius TaxID=2944915 RepID=A0ABT1MGD9_9BACT|nr:hypothetical protein [Coprobacter tertius]MCP9611703.1 hypothetical protein [Coprobacter tertius]